MCRRLFFDSVVGWRLVCGVSLMWLSRFCVWLRVVCLGALPVNRGRMIPLSVANLGSRRRNRQINFNLCCCVLACVWLDRLATLCLDRTISFVFGALSSFVTRSSADPFVLSGVISVIILLCVMARLSLCSILIVVGALGPQAPVTFLSCRILSTV